MLSTYPSISAGREAKCITRSPDELVRDNLVCIFKSDPVDVATKARHKRWLEEHVNGYMVRNGYAEASRLVRAAAVKRLYETNESPLHAVVNTSRATPPRH